MEAMWLSSSAVACKLPASDSPQNVTIEISSNGVDFTQSSTSFSYTRTTTLLRLQPSFGPVLGGSRIEILGGFWTADAHTGIQFGVQRASMSIVSSSKVVCLAPPATMGAAGAVEVHLSLQSVGFGASEILRNSATFDLEASWNTLSCFSSLYARCLCKRSSARPRTEPAEAPLLLSRYALGHACTSHQCAWPRKGRLAHHL